MKLWNYARRASAALVREPYGSAWLTERLRWLHSWLCAAMAMRPIAVDAATKPRQREQIA
jgi:hypothetical protein